MKKNYFNILFLVGVIILTIITRMIPHLSNFTSVFALGIILTSITRNKILISGIVVATMFLSDIFIGFYPAVWAIYASMAITVILSSLFV